MYGLGKFIAGIGWVALGIIDLLSLFAIFATYGLGWGIASLIFFPAWLVIPFIAGLGVPYIVAIAVTGLGLVIASAVEPEYSV